MDRLQGSLGYVQGNIAVMSLRANRFKNDATLPEIEALLDWLRLHQPAQGAT